MRLDLTLEDNKMNLKRARILSLTIVSTLSLASPAAQARDEQVGGLRLSEAFPDAKVSTMVAAARSGNFRRVNELIAGGVDVNYRGAHGITPLAWVVAANDLGAARHLLESKADPNASLAKDGSALAIAVERGSARMLELLLTRGGDPNLRAPGTDPLLHIATLNNRRDHMDVLFTHGADINALSERDRSTAATLAVGGRPGSSRC